MKESGRESGRRGAQETKSEEKSKKRERRQKSETVVWETQQLGKTELEGEKRPCEERARIFRTYSAVGYCPTVLYAALSAWVGGGGSNSVCPANAFLFSLQKHTASPLLGLVFARHTHTPPGETVRTNRPIAQNATPPIKHATPSTIIRYTILFFIIHCCI